MEADYRFFLATRRHLPISIGQSYAGSLHQAIFLQSPVAQHGKYSSREAGRRWID